MYQRHLFLRTVTAFCLAFLLAFSLASCSKKAKPSKVTEKTTDSGVTGSVPQTSDETEAEEPSEKEEEEEKTTDSKDSGVSCDSETGRSGSSSGSSGSNGSSSSNSSGGSGSGQGNLNATSVNGNAVIATLLSHVNQTPYVVGGYDWNSGTDCCGCISLAYREHGVALADSCASQISYPAVSIDQMLPGDVIGTTQHVCIFAGWTKSYYETTVDYALTPVRYEGDVHEFFRNDSGAHNYFVKESDFEVLEKNSGLAAVHARGMVLGDGETYYYSIVLDSSPNFKYKEGHENLIYEAQPIKGNPTVGVIIELLPGGPMAISTMEKDAWSLPAAHRICTNTASPNFQGDLRNYNPVFTKSNLLSVGW